MSIKILRTKFLYPPLNFKPMKNYCMITEGRFVKTWLPIHLKIASPYVDRFVLVDDGTFPADAKEYLKQFTDKEIVIITRKWDNCHVCQRNVYIDFLKKEPSPQWCLVMDSDEFPSKQLLEFYSKVDGTTGYLTPSHDIRVGYKVKVDPIFTYFFGGNGYIEEEPGGGEEPPEEVKGLTKLLGITNYSFYKQFDFRKLNVFPITPNVRYEGTVHEALVGVDGKPIDYPYYHVKELWEVHRDGFRNYVEGGSGVNLGDKNPHYVEMKKMLPTTNWHEVRTLKDVTPLLIWVYMNAGDTGHDWSSETFDTYMYLQYATRSVLPFKYEKTWVLENPVYYEVRTLYKALLHREPDPGGLESYSRAFYEQPISKIVKSFLESAEFKERFENI